jgi:hypothetical protein
MMVRSTIRRHLSGIAPFGPLVQLGSGASAACREVNCTAAVPGCESGVSKLRWID